MQQSLHVLNGSNMYFLPFHATSPDFLPLFPGHLGHGLPLPLQEGGLVSALETLLPSLPFVLAVSSTLAFLLL